MDGPQQHEPTPPICKVGAYHLVAELGRGGMADLYLALAPPASGRRNRVVIKRLPGDVCDDEDEDYRAMFLDEARLARRLRHPNIVETIEVGKDGGSYFIVMEFLDGQPLSRIRQLKRDAKATPLSIELRIMSDVLAGLHYLHEVVDEEGAGLDVVHRDVTPENVFVTYSGQVKVKDFGIAKAAIRQADTRLGVVKGKLSYLAPESLRGETVDRRCDIFAVGVMLWEAATGRRFWEGHEELSICRRLISGDLPTANGATDMPGEVFEVVKRALAPDPNLRYATARAMQSAIDALLASRNHSTVAVDAYLRGSFIDERRRFYQAAKALELRLEHSGRSIDLPDLGESSRTGIKVARTGTPFTDVASHPDRARSREPLSGAPEAGSETGSTTARTTPSISTSFASPSVAPSAPSKRRGPSGRILVGFGAGALLAAAWTLGRHHSNERQSAPLDAVLVHSAGSPVAAAFSSEPAFPRGASSAGASPPALEPSKNLTAPTASDAPPVAAAKPRRALAPPTPSAHRPVPPRSPQSTFFNQFGI